MHRKYAFAFIILFVCSGIALGMQDRDSSDTTETFRWLESSGAATGVKYATRRLQPLSPQIETGPPVDIEREEKQLDPQTKRITSRVYGASVSGERRLLETIVEEIKMASGGAYSAVRTTSRLDMNGRMSLVQKETQEAVASGPDGYRITKTLLLPGIDKKLVEKEQIQQIEMRKNANTVEIDRTRYEPGADGKWNAFERSVTQSQIGKEQTQSREQVYRYDANRRMRLVQQSNLREWTDSAGKTHLQSESSVAGIDGKLKLDSRITMIQPPLENQRQQTTEIVERPNPAAPGEGLRVVQKAVENVRALGSGKTEQQMEIFKPNLNGGMEIVHRQKAIEAE
jgi:hypothetical protein